ncbi:MAG TPA: alpha-amylase/4-alpha-glucanotransferase domain-containing protein [Abditibacteriaceae bacterium]
MYLSLVFHNHQPVGQLPWSFEDAWRDSYSPFLDVLEKHPKVKVALHYTGPLLDWLVEHKPETIALVQKLVARGQVEILAGGYNEPILAIWPREDQIAQVTLLRERVQQLFGTDARGLWLAERVWEPALIEPLAASGIDYTFVDSTVFEAGGIDEHSSHGFFSTRDSESKLSVFPINQPLRHILPWKPVDECMDYLQSVHDEQPEALAVFADDGEKFGAWPGTFDHVFTEGWLDDFFTALEDNASWLQTITPGKYNTSRQSLGEVTLPAGSYSEMQEWSRGNWRNFLERYRESRDIYEETLRVRALWKNKKRLAPSKGKAVEKHLLRAQSNDAFWHGVFGGLYLRHLRQAQYRELAEAQVLLDSAKPFARASHEASDDCILENENQKIGFRAQGGAAFLWTSKAARHNAISTLRRYRETYHVAESVWDWYARSMLVDHIFGDDVTPENFETARYREEGDFASEPWELKSTTEKTSVTLRAQRNGHFWHEGVHTPLTITKELALEAGSPDVRVTYQWHNPTNKTVRFWWGSEWNIAVSGSNLPDRHYHADNHKQRLSLEETAVFESVQNPIIGDRWLEFWFEWKFPTPLEMWHVPIYTVSQKEGGDIERTHQSSAFVFHRHIELAPGETKTLDFAVTLTAKRAL